MSLLAALIASLHSLVLFADSATASSLRLFVLCELHSQLVAARCGRSSAASVSPLSRLGIARVDKLDEAEPLFDGDLPERTMTREELLEVASSSGVGHTADVQTRAARRGRSPRHQCRKKAAADDTGRRAEAKMRVYWQRNLARDVNRCAGPQIQDSPPVERKQRACNSGSKRVRTLRDHSDLDSWSLESYISLNRNTHINFSVSTINNRLPCCCALTINFSSNRLSFYSTSSPTTALSWKAYRA